MMCKGAQEPGSAYNTMAKRWPGTVWAREEVEPGMRVKAAVGPEAGLSGLALAGSWTA